MTGELLTFPIRLGLRAARVAARGGLQASEGAISLASFVLKRATSSASRDEPRSDDVMYAAPAKQSAPASRRSASDATPARPVQSEPVTARPPSPAHVSEEPTLVEEFAEAGAENGAGAQVHIAEPWDGYAHMNAQDIIARLSHADAAELAAVQLYEAAHRSRATVMTVVERELRAKSGRGAATADQTRKEHTNGG
jgi:hypothetical protein